MTCVGTCPHLRVQDAPDLLSPGTVIVLPLTIHRRFLFWKMQEKWLSHLLGSVSQLLTAGHQMLLDTPMAELFLDFYSVSPESKVVSAELFKKGYTIIIHWIHPVHGHGIWQLSGHIYYCDEVGGLESSQVSKSPQVILTLRPAQSWAENRRKSRGETENRECQGLFKI